MSKHVAYVGLGSNLGSPDSMLHQGLAALAALPQTQVLAASSLYRSAPIGAAGQPDFVNAVARLSTGLAPLALLAGLLDIERGLGRKRSVRNAPRTLDLDLLLYDADVIAEPGLAVPHPRMHERGFVLLPLLEISPDCLIPGKGPAAQWLERSRDQIVERIVQCGSH